MADLLSRSPVSTCKPWTMVRAAVSAQAETSLRRILVVSLKVHTSKAANFLSGSLEAITTSGRLSTFA